MEELDTLPRPGTARPRGKQYRIIATHYPPIDFFEQHVPPELLGPLWELEAQTNPRLLECTGELHHVAAEDRVSGAGASIVMAAFTHIGWPSRFTDGSYGVYYGGLSLETAIRETVHHRERIASDAHLDPAEFSMRAWVGTVKKPLHDIRSQQYAVLHDPNPDPADHPLAQAFGRMLRAEGSWGVWYRSVRHPGGECIAALRPPAVSLPTQGPHLIYVWNGERITEVYEKSEPLIRFE